MSDSPPYRLVLPDLTGWLVTPEGRYRLVNRGMNPAEGEERTRADLEAAGGVPVEPPPQEEIDRLLEILRAAGRYRAASVRSGWLEAMNVMVREYSHLGGLYRLYSGRPGCWEVEDLRRMEHGYDERHVVDPAAEQAVCEAAVRWVTGFYVAHPEHLYEVCLGAWRTVPTGP